MRKTYLQYFETTLLTYKTEKLLIMTYTLRYWNACDTMFYSVAARQSFINRRRGSAVSLF